jgi:hypothetical protein
MHYNIETQRIEGVEVADPYLAHIVARHHVSEGAWDIMLSLFPQTAVEGYRASFRESTLATLPARTMLEIWAQVWNEQEENRDIYQHVMKGSF